MVVSRVDVELVRVERAVEQLRVAIALRSVALDAFWEAPSGAREDIYLRECKSVENAALKIMRVATADHRTSGE